MIPAWFQLLVGAIALGREIVKYLREKDSCKRNAVKKVNEFTIAIRRARETGETDDVEKLLGAIVIGK